MKSGGLISNGNSSGNFGSVNNGKNNSSTMSNGPF